jgi:plastocyanin
VAGAIILGDRPNYFPPVLMQQFPTQALFLIGMGTVIGLVLMLGIFRRASLRKPLAWSIGLLLFALIAVGWLWGSFINPYVGMTPTSFIRNTVSISTGDTLHMQNPANGVAQTLCIGVNQKCQPEDGAPGLLNRGIELQPGQSITITFNTNGNYHITSETTPGMNLSVDVSTSDADVSY